MWFNAQSLDATEGLGGPHGGPPLATSPIINGGVSSSLGVSIGQLDWMKSKGPSSSDSVGFSHIQVTDKYA